MLLENNLTSLIDTANFQVLYINRTFNLASLRWIDSVVKQSKQFGIGYTV